MWLLDVNLPNGLIAVLREQGVQAETTDYRGWRVLGKASSLKPPWAPAFECCLRATGFSASRQALERFLELATVIIRLPQSREASYLAEFRRRWAEAQIRPTPGQVTVWP